MGHPTVYPTGVTIFDKDAAAGGWTLCVLDGGKGAAEALLLDLNGREAKRWKDAPPPAFDGTLAVETYRTSDPAVSGKPLLDNKIVERGADGSVVWEWRAASHFGEFGFDEAAKNALYRLPNDCPRRGGGGLWLDIRSAFRLGPNRLHDAGDKRFAPENVVFAARNANILAVIEKESGRLAWRLGPDFRGAPSGWIVGPTHISLIPKGLPGEGNFLIFDAGGAAGYGPPRDVSADGTGNVLRDFSRVLELDPATLEVVWKYTPVEAGFIHPLDSYKFHSPFSGTAQRLANGNTLIAEGDSGRVFEVTAKHRTVWEYLLPGFRTDARGFRHNRLAFAVRFPYERFADLPQPVETAVTAPNVTRLRVPGAPLGSGGGGKITRVEGVSERTVGGKPLIDDPLQAIIAAGDKAPSNFCVLNSGNDK